MQFWSLDLDSRWYNQYKMQILDEHSFSDEDLLIRIRGEEHQSKHQARFAI